MRDPTDLIGNEAEAQLEEQEAQRQRLQELDDYKWLMGHKQGRRLVRQWLADAGVYRNPFNHSGSVTAFNCGQLNAGQRLLAKVMEFAPEAYLVLLKEHANE